MLRPYQIHMPRRTARALKGGEGAAMKLAIRTAVLL